MFVCSRSLLLRSHRRSCCAPTPACRLLPALLPQVAAKLMDRAAKMSKLTPPEDRTICTLFVGGVAGALRCHSLTFGRLRLWHSHCAMRVHLSSGRSSLALGMRPCARVCGCPSHSPRPSRFDSSPSPKPSPSHLAFHYATPPCHADDVSEDDLRDQFYPYGELKSVKKVASRSCAFVTYATREAAERAADELANK